MTPSESIRQCTKMGKVKRRIKEVREDVGKKGERVREKEEDETVVNRKCVNPVSVEVFDIFSQLGNFGVRFVWC